jgi:tetratricopeptide (TPR) repeat protein
LEEARYKAFISYSHTDDKWARWLHRSLESYKPPKYLVGQRTRYGVVPGRLAPIFRDREELPSANDLGAVISEALAQSACQLVVCSPAAARSKWVNEEIVAFKRLGREDRIFCLIVAGEPNATDLPGRADEECFPPALRYKLAADGNLGAVRTEPIAADARDAKDGPANATIKLIAGMLGVGFDDLRQRELHRRNRRMMAIAAVSMAGMVVTTGLSIAALLARSEAVEQRARAQTEAETSRQVTSFLVELFEVSDPSEALGNTITAREILDSGARRIEFELQDQPAIRATLMDTMGTVYKSLGLYDDARTLLERGLATRRTLFGDRNLEVARSEANIGQVLGLQAEFATATQMYEKAIQTQREATELNPAELAQSLLGLAHVRSLEGMFEEAERLLREAIELQRPTADTTSLDLARSLDQLGLALASQARYEEAEPLLREALAMRRTLIPSGVHPDITDSLNNLAVFLYEAGEYAESEKLFRESLDIIRRLLGENHPNVAVAYNNLAFVLHDAKNFAAAEEHYQRALDIRIAALGAQHPQTAQSLNNLAFVYYDQGKVERALELSRQALAIYRSAYGGDHPEVAYGLQNLAGWLVEQGDYEEARPMLEEALAMNQRLLPSGHTDIAITQSGMAVLLLKTGQPDDALAIAAAARESLAAAFGAEHWRAAWAEALEGASLSALRRFDEAEPLLTHAYGVLSLGTGARVSQIEAASQYLVDLYTAWGRPEDAARYRDLRTAATDTR